MDPEALLAGLDAEQCTAVTTPAAPLCILAGAGSGKTRVLTRRVAHRLATGTADPRHVLVLTFTRKAAGELSSRLSSLGIRERVAAGTFHAIAYAQLRNRWAESGKAAPTLLDRKVRLLVRIMGRSGPAGQASDVAAEIEWAKARMVSPAQYEAAVAAAGRRPPMAPASVAALFERYEEEKRRQRLVDFDDLLHQVASALENDSQFGDAQRWRFRHLFVDEFQDVNPLQHRLLEAWRDGRDDLCVVGDAEQAIYSWNGADAGFLNDFLDLHPGADVVRLTRNYRSTPQVISVANGVLAAGRPAAPALTATRPDGPLPKVRSYSSDLDEARGIARALRDAHGPGVAWSHLAVLTRTHAQATLLAEALRGAGVPYRLRGGTPFLDQPEVRAALRNMQQSTGTYATAVVDLAADIAEARGAPEGSAPAERVANLEALLRLARDYESLDPSATVEGFLSWLSATVRADEPDRHADAVDVATFHAAKGLEWPVVFLAGLEHGLVPISHATTPEARAEEQRLLYVALTRAQRVLHCSWAARRTMGDRSIRRKPSEWLAAIEQAVAPTGKAVSASDWKRRLAHDRQRIAAARTLGAGPGRGRGSRRPPGAPDGLTPVLDALKAWRSTTARAAGVPAYTVFHDRTLEAVAESRPRDRESLLAVPGIGPVKVARYGDALLDLVARHGR